MKQDKISVIIPCYNSEITLSRAIDSVLMQTYQNIEVVLIDDGSTDKTSLLLFDYTSKYPSIIYKSNERNFGAGYSKNLGISVSTGNFIGFVDSDDYIDPDFYERLYNVTIDTGADITCADIAVVHNDIIAKQSILENIYFNNYHYRHKNQLLIIPSEIVIANWAAASACSKLFKRECIVNFPFYEGVCDDLSAVIPALAHSKHIAYCPGIYYYYVQDSNTSIERSPFSDKRLEIADIFLYTISKIRDLYNNELYSQLFFSNCILGTIMIISNISDINKQKEYLKQFRSRLWTNEISELFDFKKNSFILKKLLSFGDSVIIYNFTLIHIFINNLFDKHFDFIIQFFSNKDKLTKADLKKIFGSNILKSFPAMRFSNNIIKTFSFYRYFKKYIQIMKKIIFIISNEGLYTFYKKVRKFIYLRNK